MSASVLSAASATPVAVRDLEHELVLRKSPVGIEHPGETIVELLAPSAQLLVVRTDLRRVLRAVGLHPAAFDGPADGVTLPARALGDELEIRRSPIPQHAAIARAGSAFRDVAAARPNIEDAPIQPRCEDFRRRSPAHLERSIELPVPTLLAAVQPALQFEQGIPTSVRSSARSNHARKSTCKCWEMDRSTGSSTRFRVLERSVR
jgi:hypothetical protein